MVKTINALTPEVRSTTINYLNAYISTLHPIEDMEKVENTQDIIVLVQNAQRLSAKLRNEIISTLNAFVLPLQLMSMSNAVYKSDLNNVEKLITYYRGI